MTTTASLLLLFACGVDQPAPEPTLDAAEAEAAAEALLASPPVPPADRVPGAPLPAGLTPAAAVESTGATVADPARIELQWTGIGPLHKGFFSDRDAVTHLSAGLTGEVKSPVPIAVRYDSTNFAGQIRLLLDPGALLRPVAQEDDALQLQDLSTISQALARYRSEVSGRFDVRLESFEVGIESVRAGRACTFRLAGPPPPDGRLVSPCVEVNGKQHCGTPTPQGVRFSEAVADDVAACLDLSR